MESVTIVIADDHPIIRKLFKNIFRKEPQIHFVGEANDGNELLEVVKKMVPDIAIIDLDMPVMNGYEAILKISTEYPDIKTIALSGFLDRKTQQRAIDMGAYASVSKSESNQKIFKVIKEVIKEQNYHSKTSFSCCAKPNNVSLTRREKQILNLVAEGKNSKEISRFLNISKLTVDKHRSNIREKTGTTNLVEMLRYAHPMEEHFYNILDCSSPVVYTKNLQGQYTWINKRFEDFSGLKKDDVLGKTDFELFPKSVAINSTKNDKKVIETKTSLEKVELAPIHSKMSSFISSKYPICTKDGKIYGICGISIDTTGLKTAQKALANAKKQWEKTFDAIDDWICIIDLKSAIQRSNITGEKLFGLKIQEIIGQRCCLLAHGTDAPVETCLLPKMIETGERASSEFQIKDGRWMSITVDPLFDEEGTMTGAVHIARDITERKIAEKERDKLIEELHKALANVRKLSGLIPICSHCKKIRDDKGYWNNVDAYIQRHSEATFSHSICQECAKEHYPDYDMYED